MSLSKSIIEQAIRDQKFDVFPIKNVLGQKVVYVREGTAKQRDKIESAMIDKKKGGFKNFRARVTAEYLCDENGTRLFTSSDDDIATLSLIKAVDISLIFDEACVRNGFTKEDLDDIESDLEETEVEAVVKN